jgi:phospholipid transport system substrate-binding protein
MRVLLKAFLALSFAVPLAVHAAPTPQQIVEDTSMQVMEVLDANRETYKNDSEAFLKGLSGVMDPIVDYRGIARSVMTVRYSGRATDEQMERFINTFKRSMVQFYGNALLEFDSGMIKVLPATDRNRFGDDRTSIDMEIRTSKGMVYPVTYTMVRIDGQWKVRNVIVEGINMGLLFRDQFAQAMQTQRGDMDAVINNWGSVVAESVKTVDQKASN